MTDRVIRVTMDTSGVEQGARRAEAATGRLDNRQRSLRGSFRAAAAAATAFASALAIREIVQLTDQYQRLQNSLRVVTDSQNELNTAQARLFEIAQDTRAPLESTVELFSRASIAADELGASQEELFRLTEITGQALAVQGSSAAESAGALRQLSQSFSSGIVRAEEFNSILEGAFPIAQAAARGIDEAGGSVGRLRNLVVEGEISSREFFEAILEGGEALEDQFAATDATISQAFSNINNSILSAVGRFSEASGAGDTFARALLGVSEQIDDFADALLGTLDPQEEVNTGLQLFTSVALVAIRVIDALASSLITVLTTAFTTVGDTIGGTAAGIAAFFRGDFEEASSIFADVTETNVDRVTGAFRELRDDLIADTSQTIEAVVELWDAGARDIQEAIASGTDGGGTTTTTSPVDPEDFADAQEAVTAFIEQLELNEQKLILQRDLGDEAASSIAALEDAFKLSSAEAQIFGDLAPTPEVMALREAFRTLGEDAQESIRIIAEEIEAAQLSEAFDDQIEALEEELALLGASNEEIAINAELRALAAGATTEQAARIRELTEAIADETDRLAEENATLQGFFEEVGRSAQQTLSGFLADPLSEGLDELPFKFAQVLQQLAADALASELFSILRNLGSGGAGGGAGGFLQFVGGLFGGGFQAGGQVAGGRPILVGERGPELFTPPGAGSIVPNVSINQAAQAAPTVVVNNITDPADIPGGLRTAEGEEEVINIIQRNPDQVRRILG